MPTNLADGKCTAWGMMLPPAAQPSSSTRAVATAGEERPNRVPSAASRAGCDCGNATEV